MKSTALGKIGMRVSVIGIGTWQFGGTWGKTFTEEEVAAILDCGRELGINLIEYQRECYGENHRSETLIGHFLKGQPREEWIVATSSATCPDGKPTRCVSSWRTRFGRCRRTTWISTSSTPAPTRSSTRRGCGRCFRSRCAWAR